MTNIQKIRSGADKVFSFLLFAMAITFFISSFSLEGEAALLPRWVALVTAVLISPVIIKQWRQTTANSSEEKVKVPFYIGALFLIGYFLLLKVLGYTIATALYTIVLSRKIGLKSWIITIILALVLSVGTAYLFGNVFGVRIPSGLLLNL